MDSESSIPGKKRQESELRETLREAVEVMRLRKEGRKELDRNSCLPIIKSAIRIFTLLYLFLVFVIFFQCFSCLLCYCLLHLVHCFWILRRQPGNRNENQNSFFSSQRTRIPLDLYLLFNFSDNNSLLLQSSQCFAYLFWVKVKLPSKLIFFNPLSSEK